MQINGLDKRPLGKTGLMVTPIGVGGAWLGWNTGKDAVEIGVQTVLRGLEMGVNVLDTAAAYMGGESQVRMGMALKEWFNRGGKREDLVVSTKTGKFPGNELDYSGERTRRSIMHSLEVMNLDYLDVALIHDAPALEPVFEKGGALDELEKLKVEGYIKAIGLGLRQHEFHQHCIPTGRFDLSLTFQDFNLAVQTARNDIFDLAEEHGVAIYNASPLRNGLLAGMEPHVFVEQVRKSGVRFPRFSDGEVEIAQKLWKWARARDVNLLALNLQYCARDPRVCSVLVGPSTPEQIEMDVRAMQEPIADEIWEELYAAFAI